MFAKLWAWAVSAWKWLWGQIDFQDILEFALRLVEELVGPMPDIEDEKEFRDWLRKVVVVLDEVAEFIPGTIDDTIVDIFRQAVERDAYWAVFYRMLLRMFEGDTDVRLVWAKDVREAIVKGQAKALGIRMAVPWMLILQLALWLIQYLLKRKGR